MSLPDWAGSVGIIGLLVFLLGVVINVVALGVVPGNRKPSTGMAWLLLVLLAPGVGLIAFGFFGTTDLGRRRHRRLQTALASIDVAVADLPESRAPEGSPAYVASTVQLNRRLGTLPLVLDNGVEFVSDYRRSIALMAEEVAAATRFVHVEFYIAAWDDVTDVLFVALADAAERGVKVRLLFDHLGSRRLDGYRDFVRRLDDTGIEWHPMLPLQPLKWRWRRPDLRNHRKLLIVDGRVGFTGSQNLTEPGYHQPKNHALGREWVELMVRLHGPVVHELEAVFLSDWYVETEERLEAGTVWGEPREKLLATPVLGVPAQVVPSGPGFAAENNLRMFNTLIYGATRRISLTSPYFVPDESLLYAVTTAAQRGVDVELFVSEVSDQFMVGHAQASYYRALLDAGVRIYLYPAPYVLHSKHFTIDDDVAVVGSSNMDLRSFALNYEVSLMLLGSEVVGRLRAVEDTYRDLSHELSVEEWAGRPRRLKYVDNVMRLTSALQ